MSKDSIFGVTEPRSTAVDQVVDAVRNSLINRRLKPGDLMPSESELAELLHVSRGSIREAMKILSAFGVVDIKRGDGTYVATTANKKLFDPFFFQLLVSPADIAELAELRALVESGVVKLMLKKATDEDIAALESASRDLERCIAEHPGDRELAKKYDIAFHTLMGEATRNGLVKSLSSFVMELLAPTMHPEWHGIKAHDELVRALKARDEAAAMDAIHEHNMIWEDLNLDENAQAGDRSVDGD
jgi:DNA-binding FadR family transcriptional regulator